MINQAKLNDLLSHLETLNGDAEVFAYLDNNSRHLFYVPDLMTFMNRVYDTTFVVSGSPERMHVDTDHFKLDSVLEDDGTYTAYVLDGTSDVVERNVGFPRIYDVVAVTIATEIGSVLQKQGIVFDNKKNVDGLLPFTRHAIMSIAIPFMMQEKYTEEDMYGLLHDVIQLVHDLPR